MSLKLNNAYALPINNDFIIGFEFYDEGKQPVRFDFPIAWDKVSSKYLYPSDVSNSLRKAASALDRLDCNNELGQDFEIMKASASAHITGNFKRVMIEMKGRKKLKDRRIIHKDVSAVCYHSGFLDIYHGLQREKVVSYPLRDIKKIDYTRIETESWPG